MTRFDGKTYWIIGASEGLGRDLAHQLSALGAALVVSARNEERLSSLAKELSNTRALPLDVCDPEAVRSAAASLDQIDGIIYNAGTYAPMAATDWQSGAALQMCDVNFMGAMRLLGEVVPRLVAQGAGDITLIGSLAAYHGLPNAVGYAASKAALLSLAETLRHDLKHTGVVVRVVNPGFIRTRLTAKNGFRMPQLMDPQDAAQRVVKAMQTRRFRTDFPYPFVWVIKLLRVLPDRIVFWLTR